MEKKININKNRNFITLFVVVSMSFMATLDSSIVNVALPVMSKKLKVPISSIEWVIASYLIIICATLLLFGRLGDIRGKAKVFKWGMALFTLSSFMCGLCHTFTSLIICRLIQGVGASAYMANNQGIITEIFIKDERGKALGILAAAVALGTMIGPPAGGFIVSLLNWNFIFLINVPIGIIVFLVGLKFLPKDKKINEKIDMKGAVLQFAGTSILFASLIESQKIGLKDIVILIGIFISIIFIALFIILEKREKQPLLEISIFKNEVFSLSLICALISFICIAASTILLPFYFQDTLKLSPSKTGILLMLSPIVIAILSPVCGALSDKIGSERLTFLGLIFMDLGFFLMSFLNEKTVLIHAVIFIFIMALGQSLFQPANNSMIMSACKNEKLGIAGSVNSLVRNLGQIVGITLSTTFLYYFMSKKLKYRVSDYVFGRDDIFVYGMKNDYIILSFICFIGAVLTAIRLFKKKKI